MCSLRVLSLIAFLPVVAGSVIPILAKEESVVLLRVAICHLPTTDLDDSVATRARAQCIPPSS
jgi:hypothetical protein